MAGPVAERAVIDTAPTPPARPSSLAARAGRLVTGPRLVALLSFLTLMLVWVAVTRGGMVSDLFLPGPALVWEAFADLVQNGYKSRTLLEHAWLSLSRVLQGFLFGSVVGTALGLAMGYDRRVRAFFTPLVEFFRPLPQLAYLVLLIVWFGIGETSQVILLFLTALPVSAIAAMDGVRGTSAQRINAARSLGANRWHVFRYVIFPSALPEIFTGARLAIGVVYGTLIAAEIIAGSTGLGWMILDAGRFLRSDYVFVGIILIGTMGLLLDRLLLRAERRIVHWGGRD
jgi:taurine transport system permease protein